MFCTMKERRTANFPFLRTILVLFAKYRDLREANSLYIKLNTLYSLGKTESHDDEFNMDDEEEKKKETKGFQICLNGVALNDKKKEKMTKRIKKVFTNFRKEFKKCSE